MPGQGRLGDKAYVPADAHGCPACPHPATGPAVIGSPNVLVNRKPALRVDDQGIHGACCGPNQWRALQGSETVFINNKAAHRLGDASQHCGGRGQLIEGSANVIVGGTTSAGSIATDQPGWARQLKAAEQPAASATDLPSQPTRAALQDAARGGNGLVKKDCTTCDSTMAVGAYPDSAALEENRKDDAARA